MQVNIARPGNDYLHHFMQCCKTWIMQTFKASFEARLLSPHDLIGAGTAAEILGISRTQVTRRVQTGALKAFTKLDTARGAYVFDRNDIEAEAKK